MACFVKTLTGEAVKDIELGNPFLRMKIFPLFGVENKPITLEDVPQEFRPYPGCIFDVLSIPDKQKRHDAMKEFFANLCNETCPTRKFSLLYTVMHCWKAVFAVSMSHPPMRHILRTFEWLVEMGMFQSLMRILNLCLDQEFLAIEYNRYVPYRILETIFGAMQAELVNGDDLIQYIIEELDLSVKTFVAVLEGKLTFVEQLMAQQVIGNFSCYPRGMILLVDAPQLAGLTGKFLWISYDILWYNYTQYDERKLVLHRNLLNTDIQLDANPTKVYLPGPYRSPDLCAYSALCCMCNICAGFPDECGMDKVDDCLVALVSEGYYWHLGTIATGIHLSQPKYSELTIDKFLSLTSWSGFNHINQKLILDQLNSLPAIRKEEPLMFFPRSKCRGRSVVAFLITHALWLDFDRGTHFSILGLMYLLKEIPEVGRAVVDAVGSQIVDLAHSIHHVKLPGDGDPMAVKRGLFEPILQLAGMSFFNEQGDCIRTPPDKRAYRHDEWPNSVLEIREFCLRHIREVKLRKEDREKNAMLADALKVEGNTFYGNGELEAAIECYTRALDTCPLKCTEKRVTYHSNRAECYLQTNQPRKAIKDCNRALAMNPFNMKARWRRSQAFQKIDYNYPAALDLITIKGKQEDALKIIGKAAYNELENTIFQLLDQQNFKTAASHKFSNRVHNDTVQKTASVKLHELERSLVPPYRAKTYRDLIGRSPGGYHVKCGSDDEDDEEAGQKKGTASNVPDYEREFQRKMEKMNTDWLYRESEYRTPAQKMGMEREWMERRRLLVERYEQRKERAEEKTKIKQKKAKGKRKDKDVEKKTASDEDAKTPEENGKVLEGEGGGERKGEKKEAEKGVEGKDVTIAVENGEVGAKEAQAVEKEAEKTAGESGKTSKNANQDSKSNSKKASSSSKRKGSGTAEAMRDLFLAMETLDVGYEQGTMKEEELEALEQAEDDDDDDQ